MVDVCRMLSEKYKIPPGATLKNPREITIQAGDKVRKILLYDVYVGDIRIGAKFLPAELKDTIEQCFGGGGRGRGK